MHRLTPEHLRWCYDPDPFAAKTAQEERQRKAAALREKKDRPETADDVDLGGFDRGMEVKMATGLRDMVESAVKKVSVVSHSPITVFLTLLTIPVCLL